VGFDVDELQPLALDEGVVEISETKYPVTPVLSVPVKLVMETVKDVDVDGMTKAVTVGPVEGGINPSVC